MSDSAGPQPKAPIDRPSTASKRRPRFRLPFLPRWAILRRHHTTSEHRSRVAHMEFSNAALSIISTTLGLATAVLGLISYNATQAKQDAQDQTKKLSAENSELMKKISESNSNDPASKAGPRISSLMIELGSSDIYGVGISLDKAIVGAYEDNELEYGKDYQTRQLGLELSSNIKASKVLAYVSSEPTRKLCANAINSAPTTKPITNLTEGMYICIKSYAGAIVLLEVTKTPTDADPTLELKETYWAN